MHEPLVAVKCLRHVYPDHTEVSLCGLELEIQPGEIVAVLAANGAGKTTLLHHITGMLRPVDGSVRVFGLDPYEDFERVRTRLGVVFQNPAEQIIGPTVEEDIAFGMGHLKLSSQELGKKVEAILQRLGISHLKGKVPHYLSGGEVKKVALAGALVTGPELLVLDEPFSQLDMVAVKALVSLLRSISREDKTAIVFTSHQLDPVALLADTVYVLHAGQVVAQGKPIEVFQQRTALGQSGLQAPDLFRLVELLQQGGMKIHADLDVEKVASEILAAAGL